MNIFYFCLESFSCTFIFQQISPARVSGENYYDVDGVLTTKLEQVDISKPKQEPPRCEKDGNAVIGKNKTHYLKHAAFCLETQNYPDAVHHVRILAQNSQECLLIISYFQANFPSPILNPGEVYSHKVVFKFGVEI
jgi:hypothetical protein